MFKFNEQIGIREIIFIVFFLTVLILLKYFIQLIFRRPKKEKESQNTNKIIVSENANNNFKFIHEHKADPFGEQPPFDDSRYNNERREEVINEAKRRHEETLLNTFGHINKTCTSCGKLHKSLFDTCGQCFNNRLN